MSKQEFVDRLRRSLAGEMEHSQVEEHIRYYSDYIDSQIRSGKTEEEVMLSLGDPRLIAKTLLGMEGVETTAREYVEEETQSEDDRYVHIHGKTIRIPGWLLTLLVCAVSLVVLTFVFALVTWLLPFFLLIMMGVFCYRFIRSLFM